MTIFLKHKFSFKYLRTCKKKKKMTNTSSEHKLNLEWKKKITKLFCLMRSGGEDKEKPAKFAKAFSPFLDFDYKEICRMYDSESVEITCIELTDIITL